MAEVLGLDCKAYLVTSGTVGTDAVYSEATSVTSVDVSNTRDVADITRRGGNGYKQEIGTLAAGSVSFDLIYDTTDTFVQAIATAFRNKTEVVMWFGSGPIDSAAGAAQGLCASFGVTDFSESQSLTDAVRYSVSLSIRGSSPTPGYYETNGAAEPELAIIS